MELFLNRCSSSHFRSRNSIWHRHVWIRPFADCWRRLLLLSPLSQNFARINCLHYMKSQYFLPVAQQSELDSVRLFVLFCLKFIKNKIYSCVCTFVTPHFSRLFRVTSRDNFGTLNTKWILSRVVII